MLITSFLFFRTTSPLYSLIPPFYSFQNKHVDSTTIPPFRNPRGLLCWWLRLISECFFFGGKRRILWWISRAFQGYVHDFHKTSLYSSNGFSLHWSQTFARYQFSSRGKPPPGRKFHLFSIRKGKKTEVKIKREKELQIPNPGAKFHRKGNSISNTSEFIWISWFK